MYLGRRVTIHINAARGESFGSSQNGFSCWSSWPTYPPFSSPLLKPVCGQPSEGACTRRSHWGRQLDGSSCLDALALLPYSLATPQSLLPFYSHLRFSIPMATNSSQCRVYYKTIVTLVINDEPQTGSIFI